MKSNFVIWTNKVIPDTCSLYELIGVEKQYQLRKGISRSLNFTDQAAFVMHPDRPNDTILTDNLYNIELLIVGSRRLRSFLEERDVPQLDYLPVRILNHKLKLVSRDYCIINPLDPVDCIDLQKSEARMDPMNTATIDGVARLVIDESKVREGRVLFRPKGFYWVILIHRQLAEAIDACGFTGVGWTELDAFSR
jgi:hypothetical protein